LQCLLFRAHIANEFRSCCRLWLKNSCTAQRGERREGGPVWPDSSKLVQIRWSPALCWLDSAPSLTPPSVRHHEILSSVWKTTSHFYSFTFFRSPPDSSGARFKLASCELDGELLSVLSKLLHCLLACLFAGLQSLVLSAVVVGSSAHTAAAADRQESSTPCSNLIWWASCSFCCCCFFFGLVL
jgi:hypothetical protein